MASLSSRVVIATSNLARKVGSALDNLGAKLEVAKYTERLVPSTRFVAYNDVAPVVSEYASFVAPSASVIGDVTVGKQSSIWYGATVRGDVNKITIGENSSIGDCAVVHVSKIQSDFPTHIGNKVTIGPGAIIHAATIHDNSLVGASAQVLDGSVVESDTIIAPGSVVTPGTTVKSGKFYAGSPAKEVRALTTEELASITESAADTMQLASVHAFECEKDYKQVVEDMEDYEDKMQRDDDYFPRPTKDEVDNQEVLGQGIPGRIFDSALTDPERAIELMNKEKK